MSRDPFHMAKRPTAPQPDYTYSRLYVKGELEKSIAAIKAASLLLRNVVSQTLGEEANDGTTTE